MTVGPCSCGFGTYIGNGRCTANCAAPEGPGRRHRKRKRESNAAQSLADVSCQRERAASNSLASSSSAVRRIPAVPSPTPKAHPFAKMRAALHHTLRQPCAVNVVARADDALRDIALRWALRQWEARTAAVRVAQARASATSAKSIAWADSDST